MEDGKPSNTSSTQKLRESALRIKAKSNGYVMERWLKDVFHVIDKTSYRIVIVGDLDQVDRFLSRFPD